MSRLPNSVPKPKKRAKRLKRGTLTRSTKRLKRTTRMKNGAGSRRREGRMYAGRRDNAFMAWLHTMPCAVCQALGVEQTTGTEVEHFVLRSQGGYDRGDCYPTCGAHRELRHGQLGPKAFTKMLLRVGMHERALCDRLAQAYEAEQWPCP